MLDNSASPLFKQYLAIAWHLAGKLDFNSAIRAVAGHIALIVPHDHMDVCIIMPGSRFHMAYESGFETAWSRRTEARIEQSPLRSILTGEVETMLTGDAMVDPAFHFEGAFVQPIMEHRLRSRVHVALKVRGETIGALSFSDLRPDMYSAVDVERARWIADLIAPYFFALRASDEAKRAAIAEAETRVRAEGLRVGALRLTEALEAERQRIGMDLHDQTLADMTRFARRLERLSQMKTVPGDMLSPLFQSLQQSMRDLRQIIEQARPSVLELFGLVEAIDNHLDRSVRDSGLTIGWRLSDESDGLVETLPQPVLTALFRIAQEAINNAVRHGQASRIAVRLAHAGGRFRIEIRDDGIGLAPGRETAGSGIGNMKTRARLIGAHFTCRRQGAETVVEVTLPLPREG
ncbi:sensor histidine kinase [Rhizobiaceae bacterium BDR2-2]|uniref:histidine kinase n=1 Tax=Ectorhizobium quercum TaxID=2965071 RepID=A0AAE3MZN8_9HYPH|nr:sensor histidine kinase [Ectorhizobium quercum]MCX8998283.1 sensor histidine kinase [Ectorhizobium quercum]